MPTTRSSLLRTAGLTATAALAVVALTGTSDVLASVIVGSPGDDVSQGSDTDNAANRLIQPPGVSTPQHLDNTDVLFGRLGDDFMTGRTGSDVLIGGPGSDVLVGGPDTPAWPGSDTSLGDEGDDVAVWGSGDRSETFVGDVGNDTQVVGRLLLRPDGSLRTTTYAGRTLPKASLQVPGQTCALTRVPASAGVGEQYLLRVLTGGRITATLRMRDVERAVCSTPRAGYASVADLRSPTASFRDVPLASLGGVVGAIVAP